MHSLSLSDFLSAAESHKQNFGLLTQCGSILYTVYCICLGMLLQYTHMACTYPVRVSPGPDTETNGLFELLHIVKPEWDKSQVSVKVRKCLLGLLYFKDM